MLYVVDFYNFFIYLGGDLNMFHFGILNFLILRFFLLYDYFFYISYQYPFDGYIEDTDTLIDNKFFLKHKLRSRIYRYYYYYYSYNYKLNYGHSYFHDNNDTIIYTAPFHKYRHKLSKVPS